MKAENNKSRVTTQDLICDKDTIEVSVFTSFEDLMPMQEAWDVFMESVEAEIFLTYDWCRIWWKYYGKKRELSIFIFRYKQDIVAILPLFFEKIWLGPLNASVVKIVGTDYMPVTITVPIKQDFMNQVIELLIKELQVIKWCWDMMYVGAIAGKYQLMDQLVNAFKIALEDSYNIDVRSREVQTYFQVADTWEHQVADLPSTQRRNVNRTYRAIGDQGILIRSSVATVDSLTQMFSAFVQMHQAKWQKIGKPGHFGAWPSSEDFHSEVARAQLEHDRLRLLEIKFNEQTVGFEYLYKLDTVYTWFLNARMEFKLSSKMDYKWVSFHEAITSAIIANIKCIDAMRGRYDYKLLMGGKYYPINDLFIHPKKLSASIRVNLFRSAVWILNMLYSKIWRARFAPKFGFRPKAYWDKWIRFHPLFW